MVDIHRLVAYTISHSHVDTLTMTFSTIYLLTYLSIFPSLFRCVKYINENQYNHLDPVKDISIGMLITVRGNLQKMETNEFPYCFVIQVTAIDISTDPNMELYHWTSSMYLHKHEYALPWSKPLNLSLNLSLANEATPGACCCQSQSEGYRLVQVSIRYVILYLKDAIPLGGWKGCAWTLSVSL